MRFYHRPLAGFGAVALSVLAAGCGGNAGLAPAPVGQLGIPRGQVSQVGAPDAGACQYSKIVVDFTNNKIRHGDWLWFTSAFAVKRDAPVQFQMKNARITFRYGNRNFSLRTPDMTVDLGGRNHGLRLAYHYNRNAFTLEAPLKTKHRDFMGGVPFRVDHPIPGGVTGATWTAKFYGSTTEKIKWSWGAAVYRKFSDFEPTLRIKPLGDDRYDPKNTDPPGTPEAFKKWLIAGGTGNGGTQYTGGKGTARTVKLCR